MTPATPVCLWLDKLPRTAAISIYVPRGDQSPPASLVSAPRSAGGSDPWILSIQALHRDSEFARFYGRPLRKKHLFPTALRLSCVHAPLAVRARGSGGLSSQGRTPQATKPCVGLGRLTSRGDALRLTGSSRCMSLTRSWESRLCHSPRPSPGVTASLYLPLTCLV